MFSIVSLQLGVLIGMLLSHINIKSFLAKYVDIKLKSLRKREKTRHVFVKHGYPRWQQSQNMAKISNSNSLRL